MAVVLAAGRSTRMKTELPKVMHEVCGRPMLAHVLNACFDAGIDKACVVVGYGKERVIQAFKHDARLTWVEQTEQKGTGHAVQMCIPHLRGFVGDVVIIAGDMPLVRRATIEKLLTEHRRNQAALTLATAVLDDPASYGRIVRDAAGRLRGIVEDRDCTPEQKKIHEVNPSYYCFDSARLQNVLGRITNSNAKGEYYITDCVSLLIEAGERADAVTAVPAEDAAGVNSRRDLAQINDLMRRRILNELMDSGVTVLDPATTWVLAGAEIGTDTVIEPFTVIEPDVSIGTECRVGAFSIVRTGSRVPAGTRLVGAGASEGRRGGS